MRRELSIAFSLSLLTHGALFWFVSIPRLSPLHEELLADVELVEFHAPEPPAASVLASPQVPPVHLEPRRTVLPEAPAMPEKPEEPAPRLATYDSTQIQALHGTHLDESIARLYRQTPAPLPLPPRQLPSLATRDGLPAAPVPVVPDLATRIATRLAPPEVFPFPSRGKLSPQAPSRLDETLRPGDIPRPAMDPQLPGQSTLPSLTAPASPEAEAPSGVWGPVAKREPLYRPPAPSVHMQAEGEIRLKFWVRPDGVVSRVLPERRGEAALEVAAIRYLAGWRFTPLPPYEPQVEQWGTITVRFLVHER